MLYNMHDMSSDFMGKKIFVFLSLFIVPNFCWAAGNDSCTNSKDYTIDKRCYVTDEQKKEKPYNATVLVKGTPCAGTIVNEKNALYMITAKHCTDSDTDNVSDDVLSVESQNGEVFNVYKSHVGSYDLDTHDNKIGDWAVYVLDKKMTGIPYVYMNREGGKYHVRVVGYGNLKVMSDKDIKDFRQLYLDYLNKNFYDATNNPHKYGYSHFVSTIDAKNDYVKEFINKMPEDQQARFFKDNLRLKVSNCYYEDGKEVGCQTWSGTSGGGIFDDNDVIRGFHTAGTKNIGGKKHALGGGSIKL